MDAELARNDLAALASVPRITCKPHRFCSEFVRLLPHLRALWGVYERDHVHGAWRVISDPKFKQSFTAVELHDGQLYGAHAEGLRCGNGKKWREAREARGNTRTRQRRRATLHLVVPVYLKARALSDGFTWGAAIVDW
jgi:hypothetical protein